MERRRGFVPGQVRTSTTRPWHTCEQRLHVTGVGQGDAAVGTGSFPHHGHLAATSNSEEVKP